MVLFLLLFVVLLSVLINNRIFSIFIVIGLTLLLLYGGKETVHTLNQPVQTTLFSIDGELRDNPLYAEGAERTIHNIKKDAGIDSLHPSLEL